MLCGEVLSNDSDSHFNCRVCSGKCSNVSYGDSRFRISYFCHIFLICYHMWHGSGVCDNVFTVIFLAWNFCNKQFFMYDFSCDIFSFILVFFVFITTLILMIGHLSASTFLFCYFLCSYWFLELLPRFTCNSIFWGFPAYCISGILVRSPLLYTKSL